MGAGMNAASLTLGLALLAGILMAIQAPTNALLGKASGSAVVAAFISFVVGTLALGGAVAAGSGRLLAPELRTVPWYAWLGGFYGAFFVAVAAFGAPRIGVGPLLTAAIAGQLIGAIVLDHFGLLGLARQPASLEKIAGVALVLAGAWLVRRG
jgi:bacterial/archaeal transporter family-2 protein